MTLKNILSPFIIITILIFSAETCKEKSKENKKQQVANPVHSDKPSPEQVIIIFERTPCYGRCPTFKVKVFGDGKVTYQGIRAVDSLGTYTSTMQNIAITDIMNKANEIGFFEMKDTYDSNITDVPSTITGIKRKDSDQLKTVVDRAEAPAILKELEKLIDQKVKELSLIKVKK